MGGFRKISKGKGNRTKLRKRPVRYLSWNAPLTKEQQEEFEKCNDRGMSMKWYLEWLGRADVLGFSTVTEMLQLLYWDSKAERGLRQVADLLGFGFMAVQKMMVRLGVSRRGICWQRPEVRGKLTNWKKKTALEKRLGIYKGTGDYKKDRELGLTE